MNKRSFKKLSVLALSVSLGGAAVALAAAPVGPGTTPPFPPVPPHPSFCYNVDISNGTGQGANDLHVSLKGPNQIYSFYQNGHFGPPKSVKRTSTGSWTVSYVSPNDVAPGAIAHVGWCTDSNVNGMVTGNYHALPPFYWTKNGTNIGGISPLGYNWGSTVIVRDRFVSIDFTNVDLRPIRIERLDWIVVDQPFKLEDLMTDTLADQPWQQVEVASIVEGGTEDAPGSVTAVIPWSVLPTETRHMVFRVLASDPENPESFIRGFGQANIAAAVAPREGK